jgi:type I restriction enzyme S subunit
LALRQAHTGTQSIGVPDLGLAEIKRFQIPIPPLPEQHRIAARVDELMALCERLEKQLTTAQTESRRLLESVLEEALNGDPPPDRDLGRENSAQRPPGT